MSRDFNGAYEGEHLSQIAFPMGGMGAGMICLEGIGALSKFSLRHFPELNTDRRVFAALSIRGAPSVARVLEGPVQAWKLRPQFSGRWGIAPYASWGLPRFSRATFNTRFPFANVGLKDEKLPLAVEITGWSPFSPNDADNASLPVVGIEYRIVNETSASLDVVFSFHAEHFMAIAQKASYPAAPSTHRVVPIAGGFILDEPGPCDRPWEFGQCAIWVEEADARINPRWFAGPSVDQGRMLWNEIVSGGCEVTNSIPQEASAGGSLYVPLTLTAGQSRTIELKIAWYVPRSQLLQPDFRINIGDGRIEVLSTTGATFQPWYASCFANLDEVQRYWQTQYASLRESAERFSQAFYNSSLPPEVLEAVAANLSILKSPTVLRQTDGRLWCWEGCFDEAGSCYGSASHVWNYAQALPHLFANLERTLRETELGENLGADGFQATRAALPVRPIGDTREDGWGFPAAADGQLGTIIKTYRDWRISGDTAWLERLWPRLHLSLDYCIETWDPKHRGLIEEPHINTYDRPLWGADSYCTSLYVGALKAATLMGEALGAKVERYALLLATAVTQMEEHLFDGEYFFQRTEWKGLRAPFPPPEDDPLGGVLRAHPAMLKLAREEGPPYQYGTGCLAGGLMGAWLAWACGLGDILDRSQVESHLRAVHRYNWRDKLADHADIARPDSGRFGCGQESGLVLCTWPKGGRGQLPMIFSDEVWTGIEYEVASHLVTMGRIDEGLQILRACRRRYDGRVRNPFDEIESGHWYARALSSYALLQAFNGARFDAVDRVLYLSPNVKGDFRSFISTATGYGTVGVRSGQPFVEVAAGQIPYRRIEYSPNA